MGEPAKRRATVEDLLAIPPHHIGEIVNGVLHTQPRPRTSHARVASRLTIEVGGPFDRGRGGPGGWIILDEPELHLGPDVLVPDLAGWRREKMPELPHAAHLTIPPQWACEVLSPSTAALDRADKMDVYARERVDHVWLVDPEEQLLEVFRLDGATFRRTSAHRADARVRVEPFEAIELELAALWER